MDEVDILGVKVHKTNYEEITKVIKNKIEKKEKFWIATPNPEIVLKSIKDEKFREMLNSADLRVSDGIGLTTATIFNEKIRHNSELRKSLIRKMMLWIGCLGETFNREKVNTVLPQVSGDVIFEKLLLKAKENNWSIFLLGGSQNSAKLSEQIISSKYGIEVNSHPGAKNIREKGEQENEEIVKKINKVKPNLLFVAYGAPWQERWIYENLEKLNVNLATGIGGAIDEFAHGKVTPNVFRNNGFRWLWRLIREPSRVMRIFRATIVWSWANITYYL